MLINTNLVVQDLVPAIHKAFEASARKLLALSREWNPAQGTPVFTVQGRYTSRGWTEWTQGFQFGSAILQFDATGDTELLELGKRETFAHMATHLSHIGVHDHGFNNISTYGNLWRLMREGRIPHNELEKQYYELALKISGAIQAARWTALPDGSGFIHSFNGPHSLFVDTIRSLRVLAVAHQLGHVLMAERDQRISLLRRLLSHALLTAKYNVYYGESRDAYDTPGRTAHESIFNVTDGSYRCPNSQQGYSPFSTWTRGLAWALLGFSELLEFLTTISDEELSGAIAPEQLHQPPLAKNASEVRQKLEKAAVTTAEFYIANTCRDGIPIWDTGAPGLCNMAGCLDRSSDPFNEWEPVDSSAAAIAAQGFLRLAHLMQLAGRGELAMRYRKAGITTAKTLLSDPYLETTSKHHGLLLHSVYHRPNGWDYVAPEQKVPNGESSMWGDYHLRELALMLLRDATEQPRLVFFRPVASA